MIRRMFSDQLGDLEPCVLCYESFLFYLVPVCGAVMWLFSLNYLMLFRESSLRKNKSWCICSVLTMYLISILFVSDSTENCD